MKIVMPSYKILTNFSEGGIKELQLIETVGRTCYMSQDRITEDGESAKKFVAGLIKNGHEAMIEFGDACVQFTVDRAVSHELVRHRLASFAQESQRYVSYDRDKFGGEIKFVLPSQCIKNLSYDIDEDGIVHHISGYKDYLVFFNTWLEHCSNSEERYMKLVEAGVKPQVARGVLPNATKTVINIKANFREWRHIFKLRADKLHAHPDMVYIMSRLLKDFKSRIPVLFDDIYPEED